MWRARTVAACAYFFAWIASSPLSSAHLELGKPDIPVLRPWMLSQGTGRFRSPDEFRVAVPLNSDLERLGIELLIVGTLEH